MVESVVVAGRLVETSVDMSIGVVEAAVEVVATSDSEVVVTDVVVAVATVVGVS